MGFTATLVAQLRSTAPTHSAAGNAPDSQETVHVQPTGQLTTTRLGRRINAFGILSGDIIAFAAAVGAAGSFAYFIDSYLLDGQYQAFDGPNLIQQLTVLACIAIGLCCWFARTGHYTERRLFRADLGGILSASLIGLLINGFVEFASKTNFSRLWLVLSWMLAALLIPCGRIALRRVLLSLGAWQVNAVIIGKGAHRGSIASSLSKHLYLGYNVVLDGSVSNYVDQSHRSSGSRLDRLVQETNAHTIILVPTDDEMQCLGNVVDALNVRMIPYKLVPPIDKLPLAGLSAQSFLSSDAVVLTVQVGLASPISQSLKRLFDIVASSLLLVMLTPIFLMVSLAVAADGGPVFFAHERIGHRGRVFGCLKFRTMIPNAAAVLEQLLARSPAAQREWNSTHKLRNDPRKTKIGSMLRAASIDELPQLINVLRGEMSLVGPRPVVQQELLDHYKSDHSYYLLVRPGITGLWQISGRSDTDYERRVHLDAWYVRNWSLWGDIIILAQTLPAVIATRGAY